MTVSLLVKFATFEFATYMFVSVSIGKVQDLHARRGKLKRRRNILKIFFSRAIKEIFSMVYEFVANWDVANLTSNETGCYHKGLLSSRPKVISSKVMSPKIRVMSPIYHLPLLFRLIKGHRTRNITRSSRLFSLLIQG